MLPNMNNRQSHANSADFHGAAIIDANGREVPITEEMIREACDKLAEAWTFPVRTARQAG